jgi:phospholipase C
VRWLFQGHGVLLALVAMCVGVVVASPTVWARSATESAGKQGDAVLTVFLSRCGQGWSHPRPAPQTLQLRNSGIDAAEAQLIEPASGAVLGEVAQPFEYYRSTANQTHKAPSSPSAIGSTDQANHQYDLADFSTALQGDNLPAVSFLKAPEYQDGHTGYSDPLDEQTFLVNTLNSLQKSKDWASTAVVVAYDDSDGWYDHQPSKIVNGSQDKAEDTAMCSARPGVAGFEDRCGYGPRLPLLVISPFSKVNHVDHTLTDQSSILRFIEDNWHTGRIGGGSYDERAGGLDGLFDFRAPHAKPVQLDPRTGAVTGG